MQRLSLQSLAQTLWQTLQLVLAEAVKGPAGGCACHCAHRHSGQLQAKLIESGVNK